MSLKNYKAKIFALLVAAPLTLSACSDTPISDDAPTAGATHSPLPNAPGRTDSREAELELEPEIIYASVVLHDDDRFRCTAGAEPGSGMNFEYVLDPIAGPFDDSSACVKALMSADQDQVRAAAALLAEVATYLEKDRGVPTKNLESALADLEQVVATDWDALDEVVVNVDKEFAAVKEAVAERDAAAEAEKRAEEERRQAAALEQKPQQKPEQERAPQNKKPTPKPKKNSPKPKDPAPKPKPVASATTGAVLSATNSHRSASGAPALRADSCAEKWARVQAEAQANSSSMSHQDLGRVMSNCGASGAAENVAYGQPNASAVVAAWFNSAGHKANMLNPSYTHMGAAVAYDKNGTPYWAQVFLKK